MCLFDLRPLGVHPAPGAAPDEHRGHAGSQGRQHVVVEPVADIGDGLGRFTGRLGDFGEEFWVGLGHTPAGGAGDQVGRQVEPREGGLG